MKVMQSRKIITTLWVKRKNSVKSAITLDTKDVKSAQDIGGNTDDNHIRVEMPLNSLMTVF